MRGPLPPPVSALLQAAELPERSSGDCCVPGSCFWYKRQLINGCGCPAGSAVASEIGLCDWALCCPADEGGVPRQQQVTTQTPDFDIHRGCMDGRCG